MITLIRGKGEDTYAWYHVVDYQKRDGRGHFNRGYFFHVGRQRFNFSIGLRSSLALISLNFSSTDDDDFSFSIALYKLIYFHFAIGHLPIVHHLPGVKWNGKYGSGERELRLSWRPCSWHWNIWTYPHESKNWWRDGWFDLTDFLLGRAKHSESGHMSFHSFIHMPEGAYPADVELYTSTWKRPRWPWGKSIKRANVIIENGVPVPGDGENSWDMDDDAILESTVPASTVAEAVEAVRQSAIRQRGGDGWIPDAGIPAHCLRN